MRSPTLLETLTAYCIDGTSIAKIARKYGRPKSAIAARLKAIHNATGVPPQQLRRLSGHLAKAEDQLSDSRASRIYRRRLTDDLPDDEESQE